MRICVDVDAPSAAEAVAVARSLESQAVGYRVGSRLLAGPGPATIAAIAEYGDVFVDARLGGETRELAPAVRSLAGFGARWITVDHRLGAEAVERSRLEAEARGAELVAVTEPPGPTEPPEGRGKAVSAATRRAAAAGFQLVMGEPADLGIVAQMAPDTGVWVVGVDDEAAALDVVGKGAVGIVLAPSVTARSDLREAVAAIAAAVEAADTIGDQ